MTAARALRGGIGACCAFLLACSFGGQSSDDGAPGDAGFMPPDAGGDSGADAGEPGFEVIVRVTADGDSFVGCGAGLSATDDPAAAVLNARQRCEGRQSYFECSCEGESKISYAYSCGVALFQACGVPAELVDGSGRVAPIASECTAFEGEPFGRCVLDDDAYVCGCEPPLSEPRPTMRMPAPDEQTHASCEQAIFVACTQDCSDEFGACAPSTDGAINAYECTCTTNGLTRAVEDRSCSQALEHACSPFEIVEAHCSGYGGFCESTDPFELATLRCTCADGETHSVDHVTGEQEPRPSPCRDTLEDACGLGTPPEGALCTAEGNGYQVRCTRGPSPPSPHVCECHAQGSLDVHRAVIVNGTCEPSMLEEACPEIAPLAEDARAMACEHLDTCGTRITDFSYEGCIENAEEVCIACVVGELSRATELDDAGCPSSRVNCHALCESVVPKEDAIEACVMRAAEHGPVTAETRCLCDRCYPAFGACLADEVCTEILMCAVEQGCDSASCQADPICGPIIAGYLGVQMRSIALALDTGACEHRDACAALRSE